MTAPDPGLTDLLAADLRSHTWGNEYENAAHEDHILDGGCKICRCDIDAIAARALLVVEQHTNGRIAELEDGIMRAIHELIETRDRAEKAEAAIARVRAVEAEYLDPEDTDIECREDVWRFIRDLRAALEGEQQ